MRRSNGVKLEINSNLQAWREKNQWGEWEIGKEWNSNDCTHMLATLIQEKDGECLSVCWLESVNEKRERGNREMFE